MGKIITPNLQRKKIKVLIGMPMYSSIEAKTLAAYTDFLVKMTVSKKFSCHSLYTSGTYLDQNREEISQRAVDDDYDYLLFLDSDMIYRNDILDKLYDRHKDIVGAIYSMRSGVEHGPAIYEYLPDKGSFDQYKYWPINKFLKVGGIGTGLLLIKVSALKKIEPPRFAYLECKTPDKDGNRRRLGEDLSFCIRCIENDIKIYADGWIWAGHLGQKVWTYQDFFMGQIIKKEHLEKLGGMTVG